MSTYVLIHGSWHGAWCWHKITPRLEAAGHKVIVPDLPGHGRDWRPPGGVTMQDFVTTVTDVLDAEAEPVVLVVHSRSGIPVTLAAEARPDKIRSLVYLAALLPPIGDSVSMAEGRNGGWSSDPESLSSVNVEFDREAGWDMLRREAFRPSLYADCSDEDVALANALLTPEPRGPLSPTESPVRTTREKFGRVPRWYIELTQDLAVSWPAQKRMYSATPCKLLSINSGHSAYFSRPDELAEKILIAGGDDVAALTSRWKAGSTSARPTSPFSNERSSMQTSNHGDSEMKDRRKYADTPSGRIAYIENGEGPVALFLHGILLNGYLWHRQLEKLGSTRRCIAVDLLAHGATEISATQDVSYRAQAQMIAQFLDALTISAVDLVANDSATAIAQIFAANYPGRVHSLTLTDGDTHDNWPPEAFKAFLTSATQGQLGQILETMITQKEMFRSDKGLGLGFEHPERIPDEAIEHFLRPFLSSPRRLRDLERFCEATFNNEQTTEIEPKLKSLKVPTLIAWATDDIFFDMKWADWLAKTIPGTRRKAEFKGARLYFPEERWEAFNQELESHWREAA